MIRIVKMHFKPENVNTFLDIYHTAQPRIEAMPGCKGVQLLRDIHNPAILFTYSRWQNDDALQNYRHSDLFISTWAKTKPLFAHRAEAWSVEEV